MVYVFDLDDTICDTANYSEKYILDFIKKHNLPYNHIATGVRFAEMGFDWPHEVALKWYKEFGDEMMLNFPIKRGVKERIEELFNAGHTIVLATARANDWHTDAEGITNAWLHNTGLKYHKLYIGRLDKEEICRDENADVFIDDDIKITGRVADYFKNNKPNGKVYLSVTDYNRNLEVVEGVEKLEDVSLIP